VANLACRALDPAAVWRWADSPVNEADLHARHVWLIQQMDDGFTDRLMGDPDFHDAKIAGWWLWGICAWIGSSWCSGDGPCWPDADGKLANGNAAAGREPADAAPRRCRAGGGRWHDLAERMRHVRVAVVIRGRVLGDSVTSRHGSNRRRPRPAVLRRGRGTRSATAPTSGTGTVAHDVREWALGQR
jgi:hypothetical protein